MKGLILKDFINLKAQSKVMLALFGFYFVLGVAGGNWEMLSFILTLLTVMLPITSLAYDERSKWDRYALTLPISRQDLVFSKYFLGLTFAGFTFALNLILRRFAGAEAFGDALTFSLGLFGVGLLILAILLPLNFKFGVEKSRLLMMVVFFLPVAAIMILVKAGIVLPIPNNLESLAVYAGIGVVLVFLASMAISTRIMNRKEM